MASLNARSVTAPPVAIGGIVLGAFAANEANRRLFGHSTLDAMNKPLGRQFTAGLVALVVFSTVFSTVANVWLRVT